MKDRVVLVTGGTGSFGGTIVQNLLCQGVSEVRVFSRDEKKQDDMRRLVCDERVNYIIGDIRDYDVVVSAVRGVDNIFHAAALKQVPSCEFFPMEAYKTNVVGTDNLLRAATSLNVGSVVCLSTDKAVYPINAMGISKAMLEKVALSYVRHKGNKGTRINITRYGNVLSSRGSVIPLFIQQLKNGNRLTNTDPGMTRFLMTLDESVDLVLEAFNSEDSGNVFVKKTFSARIGDIGRELCSIFGVEFNPVFIGKRHGEKMHESLVSSEEMYRASETEKYFKIVMDDRSLDYSVYFEVGEGSSLGDTSYSSISAEMISGQKLRTLLESLPVVREGLVS